MDESTGKAGVIRASESEGSMGKLVGQPPKALDDFTLSK